MKIDTNQIKVGTIIRTLCLILALLNQVLTVCSKSPLPITDAQVADAVALIATIGASLWAWWKNNSFSEAAIEGDNVKERLKLQHMSDIRDDLEEDIDDSEELYDLDNDLDDDFDDEDGFFDDESEDLYEEPDNEEEIL